MCKNFLIGSYCIMITPQRRVDYTLPPHTHTRNRWCHIGQEAMNRLIPHIPRLPGSARQASKELPKSLERAGKGGGLGVLLWLAVGLGKASCTLTGPHMVWMPQWCQWGALGSPIGWSRCGADREGGAVGLRAVCSQAPKLELDSLSLAPFPIFVLNFALHVLCVRMTQRRYYQISFHRHLVAVPAFPVTYHLFVYTPEVCVDYKQIDIFSF